MKVSLVKFLKSESSTRTGFGARAYAKFIKTIELYDGPIDSIKQLESIPDLSRGKIYDKCCDLLTGKIKFNEDKDEVGFKEELLSITAIGPSKVKELIDMGISNMSELKKRKNEVLNEKQLMGLKYHDYDNLRIPREEIDRHYKFIEYIVTMLPDNTHFEIVGSYRRGNKDSGDIDILITNDDDNKGVFSQFIELLKKGDYLIDDLAYGNVKYMGYSAFCGTPRRIDVLYCSPTEYPFSILYFTGSGEFNKGMRKWCLTKNYTLNEHGIYNLINKKKGDKVENDFKTENDIFEYLGLDYVEPNKRIKFTN